MAMFMNSNNLHNLGLQKNEANVYLFLLERGGQTVIELADEFNLSRMGIYKILESLTIKNLVEKSSNAYYATDPGMLLNKLLAEEKKNKLQQQSVQSLIEDYRNPKIKLYHRLSGLLMLNKELRKQIVDRGYIIFNSDFLPPQLESRRSKKKFANDLVINFTNRSDGKRKRTGRKELFIKYKNQDGFAAISVFGNRVAVYSTPKEKETYGVLIEDSNIAKLIKELLHHFVEKK